MPNITPEERTRKLRIIREAIAKQSTFNEVCSILGGCARNNVRDFMHRHDIAMPESWEPRKWTRRADLFVKPAPKTDRRTVASKLGRKTSLIGMALTADGSSLTPEQRDIADRLRIPYDRMAYLLACPNEGNAVGWRGGNAIG
jgi:hypothetical protein